MPTIRLPAKDGRVEDYATKPPRKFPKAAKPFNRVAYAAAHVVAELAVHGTGVVFALAFGAGLQLRLPGKDSKLSEV